jgi:hypothetical protein
MNYIEAMQAAEALDTFLRHRADALAVSGKPSEARRLDCHRRNMAQQYTDAMFIVTDPDNLAAVAKAAGV